MHDQLKSAFKITINWTKYQSKELIERKNWYLNCFVDPSFEGVNRLFVLSFEDDAVRKTNARYFLPKEETKDFPLWLIDKTFLINQLKMIQELMIKFKTFIYNFKISIQFAIHLRK